MNTKDIESPIKKLSFKFIFGLFLFIFVLLFFLKSTVLEIYRVPSESMQPVFSADDIILVSKIYYFFSLPPFTDAKYWYREPKSGEIIAFRLNNENLVKRIWATPGDEILLNKSKVILPSKGTKLKLNFKNLELYRNLLITEGNTVMSNGNDVFINGNKSAYYEFKYNHYYVLGDNLSNSIDSREFGTVTSNQIIGVPILKIFGENAPKFLHNMTTFD